jgi:CheY-like chemotaxis protein
MLVILIVDDDEDVRATIRAALETLAYSAEEAEDGPTALAFITERRPEVVILDYIMPGMTGGEVAAELRRTEPDLPIIFASGFAEEPEMRELLGTDAPILHKPFQIGELADLVESALLRGRAGIDSSSS